MRKVKHNVTFFHKIALNVKEYDIRTSLPCRSTLVVFSSGGCYPANTRMAIACDKLLSPFELEYQTQNPFLDKGIFTLPS